MFFLRRPLALVAATALTLVAASLLAQQGLVDLLWAERSRSGRLASVEHVDIERGIVFSVWHEAAPDTGSVLRAHDNTRGVLLWQVRVPERVSGLVTPSDDVIITGTLTRNGRSAQLTRSFDAADGTPHWRRRDPLGGDDPAPAALVSFGTRLWIVGGSGDRLVVRGLNRGGELDWQDVSEPADDVVAETLAVGEFDHARLYVAGTRSHGPGAPAPMVARRYTVGRAGFLDSGELDWETEVGDGTFRALDISVGVFLVYIVGETVEPDTGLPRWTVYALDAGTGEVVWSDMPFPGRRAASTASSVASPLFGSDGVLGPTVVGSVSRARQRSVIRSYDRATGEVTWQRRGTVGRRGRFEQIDRAFSLPPFGGRALAVSGAGRQRGDRVDRAVLQLFDAADGSVLDTRFGPSGTTGAVLGALATGAPSLVIAGGSIGESRASNRALLHVYRKH